MVMRMVERIVLGKGSVTWLVKLGHGLGPFKVVLLVRSPVLKVRICFGRNNYWIRGLVLLPFIIHISSENFIYPPDGLG